MNEINETTLEIYRLRFENGQLFVSFLTDRDVNNRNKLCKEISERKNRISELESINCMAAHATLRKLFGK